MSDWIELPDHRSRFQGRRQHAEFWCIPATVASMLTYHRIEISQEDLILGYCERFKEKAPLSRPDGSSVTLNCLTPEQVIDVARGSRLDHANFKNFGEIATDVADLTAKGLCFTHVDGIANDAIADAVRNGLKAGCPVAVSARSGQKTFHVCVALAAAPDVLRCFDPALDGEALLGTETTVFSKDLLFLEKVRL